MKVRMLLHLFAHARSSIAVVKMIVDNEDRRKIYRISREELRTEEYEADVNRKVLSFLIDGDEMIIYAE